MNKSPVAIAQKRRAPLCGAPFTRKNKPFRVYYFFLATFFFATFLTAFLAAGFLAATFFLATFLTAFLAAGFLATAFLAAGFLAAFFFTIVFFPRVEVEQIRNLMREHLFSNHKIILERDSESCQNNITKEKGSDLAIEPLLVSLCHACITRKA